MRYALIKNGIVENIILAASPEDLASMDPDWRARWDRIESIDPERDGIVEPGTEVRINDKGKVRFDRSTAPREKSRDERLEERIAALEAKAAP
jgi:hypothetical protein